MSEDDRRDLIARQHRALYGDASAPLYGTEGAGSRPPSQDVRVSGSQRGASPLAFDPYSVQTQTGAEGAVQMPPRERVNSNASPASNSTTQQSFAMLNDAQQSSRTSASSPGGSPPLQQGQSQKGVAPIGTRPTQPPGVATNNLNKRSTTPLTPSSLSYGYTSADANNNKDERSTSSASNPPLADRSVSGLGGWGGNSAVWGSGKNSTLAVQPSVWG